MNGTLALWYEPAAAELENKNQKKTSAHPPSIRLHVNLWRDLDKTFNFLDVGFLIDGASSLGRLNLLLPAKLELSSISDLSGALKDVDTLNAVFNEVAEIVSESDNDFTVKTLQKSRKIHGIDVQRDISLTTTNVPGRSAGTILALKSNLCHRIASELDSSIEHYVRLRIFLRGDARDLFTTEDKAAAVGLALNQEVLETTEFRINESRSYPPSILQRAMAGRVNLKSVHYFLIRNKDFQLGSQHQTFRKVRYLEKNIWANYLSVGHPQKGRKPAECLNDGMIIYQWRELAQEGSSLDDFIAYASFRTSRPRIFAYLMAILAIGGVGSALNNLTVAGVGEVAGWLEWTKPTSGHANLVSAFALGILAVLPMLVSKAIKFWKSWRDDV
jgi:hypothetical protein